MRRSCLALLALAACAPGPRPPAPETAPAQAPVSGGLERLAPEAWPRLRDDLPLETLERAAKRDTAYLRGLGDKAYAVAGSTVNAELLARTAEALVAARRAAKTPEELEARLKEGFDLYRVRGSSWSGRAFFSAYYQPVLDASPKRTKRFRFPLYRKPKDLVTVELGAFSPKWRGETLAARVDEKGRVVPYFDRRDVDVRRKLEGRGLEVAWLENQFDRLDLHIQGSGLLRFPDGKLKLAKYAAHNGQPYRSAGAALVGSGALSREEANKETVKRYLAEHPEGEAWLLSQNPRYVFFDVVDAPADGEPFGVLEQPLTAGRSVAVDPRFEPLGAALWLALPLPRADAKGRLLGKAETARFAFAQDVGGAIQGAGRVDVYLGHGDEAKTESSNLWDSGELYLLLQKLPARER